MMGLVVDLYHLHIICGFILNLFRLDLRFRRTSFFTDYFSFNFRLAVEDGVTILDSGLCFSDY